jgi:hypothetical protein
LSVFTYFIVIYHLNPSCFNRRFFTFTAAVIVFRPSG